MKTISRVHWLLLPGLLLVLLAPSPILANQETPEIYQGAAIFPAAQTIQVRMVSANVTFDIQETAAARISAAYILRSEGKQEEQVQVRLPLQGMVTSSPSQITCGSLATQAFSDLAVRVNGQVVQPEEERNSFRLVRPSNTPPAALESENCWLGLPIRFPAQEDVSIEVTYTASGQMMGNQLYSAYIFDMSPAAAWNGTVGTTDITFHIAYGAQTRGILPCLEGYECPQTDVHFLSGGVELNTGYRVDVLNPKAWQSIQSAANLTKQKPEDAAAWADLSEKLLSALQPELSPSTYPHRIVLYEAARAAAEHALALAPGSRAQQETYAGVFCWGAANAGVDFKHSQQELQAACVQQLKPILDQDLQSTTALQLLHKVDPDGRLVQRSGGQLVYRVLTPVPTYTFSPTTTPTPAVKPTGLENLVHLGFCTAVIILTAGVMVYLITSKRGGSRGGW